MLALPALAAVLLAAPPPPAAPQDTAGLGAALSAHLAAEGPVLEPPPVPVLHDLTGDGRAEAVVSYCVDENLPGGANEGASNPANVHCHVAVLARRGGRWAAAGRGDLGQGEVTGVRGGVIHAKSIRYAPGDPLCCPSRERALRLAMRNGRLVVLP